MSFTVLVTGVDGQVGSALMSLGRDDRQWVGLSRAELDITSVQSIEQAMALYAPDIVVNTAAYTLVDRAEDDRERAFLINAAGPRLLAEACVQNHAALIHLSTDYVFGGALGRPAVEDDPCFPLGVYGQSKFEGEQAVQKACARHLCLRTSWVFSATGACFPRAILEGARQRRVLQVVNDQFGGPTSAMAVAQVIRCIISGWREHGEMAWGTYHFSQIPHCSWYQFAQAILRIASLDDPSFSRVILEPISTEAYGARVPRPMDSRLDCSKITHKFSDVIHYLGWESDLQAIIPRILNTLEST